MLNSDEDTKPVIRLVDEATGSPILQLKLTLMECKPQIWRRILVRSDMRLDRLHRVFQIAMGWKDTHLHQFVTKEATYGMPDDDWGDTSSRLLMEKRHILADLAHEEGAAFVYEYDFGDDWKHEVVVEKVLPPDANLKHPTCLAGANACPPEDCGGVGGYEELLEAIADPEHEDHEQMITWIGGSWDLAKFDLARVQRGLKRMKA